jgi:hypothetical protein
MDTLLRCTLLWAGLLGACAAQQVQPRVLATGDTDGPPSIEGLPSLDVEEEKLTREMRMARMLSEESLNLPHPVLPQGRTALDLEAWGESTLRPWLEHKHRSIAAARQELDRAAAQNQRQRIVAGALMGLIHEDVARVLLELPVPAELDAEPEVRAVYRELTLRQAAPYLEQARLSYEACAGNARAIATLVHWSSYCRDRRDALPAVEVDGVSIGGAQKPGDQGAAGAWAAEQSSAGTDHGG